jgi:hypothetical protein
LASVTPCDVWADSGRGLYFVLFSTTVPRTGRSHVEMHLAFAVESPRGGWCPLACFKPRHPRTDGTSRTWASCESKEDRARQVSMPFSGKKYGIRTAESMLGQQCCDVPLIFLGDHLEGVITQIERGQLAALDPGVQSPRTHRTETWQAIRDDGESPWDVHIGTFIGLPRCVSEPVGDPRNSANGCRTRTGFRQSPNPACTPPAPRRLDCDDTQIARSIEAVIATNRCCQDL